MGGNGGEILGLGKMARGISAGENVRGDFGGEISTINLYYCLHKFFISVQKIFEIFFSSLDSDWSYCLEKIIKNVLTSLTYLFSFIGCVDVL